MEEMADNSTQRRLQRALRHVSDYWIPPNPKTLNKIQEGLRRGAYELDLGFLIQDLKSDLALFTYCIKELTTNPRYNQHRDQSKSDPIDLLHSAGIRCLRDILNTDAKSISRHSLESAGQAQIDQLQANLVTVSAVEALAPKFEIDSLAGFTAAALRQLGLTLIAWNYPTVFRRAFQEISPSRSLDLVISERLGYSPRLLAATLIYSWGLEGSFIFSVDDDKHTGEAVETLCMAGEALARANNPERYPSAEDDWKVAQQLLHSELQAEDIHNIKQLVKQYSDDYLELSSSSFRRIQKFDPEKFIKASKEDYLAAKNPYIRTCPPKTRKLLTDYYSALDPERVQPENLKQLVKRVMPISGFSGGAIYTLDPGLNKLIPRIRFGTIELLQVREVSYSSYSDDIISIAFDTQSPLIDSQNSANGINLCRAAAAFGTSFRVGVIYLEYPEDYMISDQEADPLNVFKAFRQAVNDSLNLAL